MLRQSDPRDGNWFGLVNDGGPEADPTRAINCGDTVLSLYDTYMHGRPRVSAPRTFDGYHNGDPTRPMDAERGVTARIEATTRSRFEGLTDVSTLDPQTARAEVRLAESRLHHHLQSLGHGAFAFITTQDQTGRTHATAAVNQNGTILYLDAQNRTISTASPLRTNTGMGFPSDVVRMDALTLDGQDHPRPMTEGDAGSFVDADPAGKGDSKVTNISFDTREEALDAAYDRAGIARGTDPDAQWEVGNDVRRRATPNYLFSSNEGSHGTYMQFETEEGSRVIAEHLNDPTRGPHFHAGEPKYGKTRTAVNFGWDPTSEFERYLQIGGKHHLDYPREES